jgi:translocation and assembly module TamB
LINSEDLPVAISQWQQIINLNGVSADFEGEFLLGDGPGSLNGSLDWQDGLLVDLAILGDAFTVHYDDSRIKVSPDLAISLSPQNAEISGTVDIPYARVKIKELPPSAVSPSRDVYLRGEPPSEALIDNVNADIMVTIDKAQSQEVKLDAFGLTASLTGGLNVQTQPALTGFGDLRILNGRYAAYGQNLLIRTGEVQFNGPLDQPVLLVEAIRDPDLTADDVIAGVRVEGPATQPSVSLFSEPTMDQAKNLAYLLNGSGGLGGGQMDENAYAAMLIGFGLSSSESLTSNVGRSLGIDDLSLGTTGQGSDTKVAISGKIAPNLTVRYGVGMFSDEDSGGQEVALRYQILSNLYLEIVRSLYTTVDLYYQFTLGDNKPPAADEDKDSKE